MYELTALYLYKAVFTVELLAAEFLMCIGMKRRRFFILRYMASAVVCIGFAFALPVVAYNMLYCSAVFLAMFGFSLLGIKFCYAESWVSVMFRGIAAYTVQHVAYQVFDLTTLGINAMFGGGTSGGAYGDGGASDFLPIIVTAIRNPSSSSTSPVFGELSQLCTYCAYLFIYILTYYSGYLFTSSRLKDSDKFELKSSALLVFVVCFVLFNVVISSVITYYSGPHFDAVYVVVLGIYNIACAFFTLYLMFAVIYRNQLEREFVASNRLLKQAEEQYALVKQNIELINLKCHDLKHQIHTLGKSSAVNKEAMKEIESVISIYDASIRTGNEALDIILTEKSLYCNRRGIRLYCIVDGEKFEFMSDADLYSLFGNLLDNAIEAVEGLEEGKRYINLSAKEINGFLTVSTDNWYSSQIEFSDGLPKTTKSDKELHGYGMKSIKLVCKKYNGEMTVNAENGMFDLSIVFMH